MVHIYTEQDGLIGFKSGPGPIPHHCNNKINQSVNAADDALHVS